jgi:O-6-methylguanine DNA methyltransferase
MPKPHYLHLSKRVRSRLKSDRELERIYYASIDTSLGTVWAAKSDKGLVGVQALGTKDSLLASLERRINGDFINDSSMFKDLEELLERWCAGERVEFDLPLDLRGTEFQKEVWGAIHRIPYGNLTSYGRLAEEIGRPRAVRAVGNAVGSNPCGIVIPCHRVIWSNGGLGGFGGGFEPKSLNIKRKFLAVEGFLPRFGGEPEKEIDLTQFFV